MLPESSWTGPQPKLWSMVWAHGCARSLLWCFVRRRFRNWSHTDHARIYNEKHGFPVSAILPPAKSENEFVWSRIVYVAYGSRSGLGILILATGLFPSRPRSPATRSICRIASILMVPFLYLVLSPAPPPAGVTNTTPGGKWTERISRTQATNQGQPEVCVMTSHSRP